jgi:hypothetical protein
MTRGKTLPWVRPAWQASTECCTVKQQAGSPQPDLDFKCNSMWSGGPAFLPAVYRIKRSKSTAAAAGQQHISTSLFPSKSCLNVVSADTGADEEEDDDVLPGGSAAASARRQQVLLADVRRLAEETMRVGIDNPMGSKMHCSA